MEHKETMQSFALCPEISRQAGVAMMQLVWIHVQAIWPVPEKSDQSRKAVAGSHAAHADNYSRPIWDTIRGVVDK